MTVTARELRCFLLKEFPDCCINWIKIRGDEDVADLGLPFHDCVDMFERIMVKYGVRIDRQDYNKLTSISKLINFINNAPDIDPDFLTRLRAGYYR
jgi:hypothetical protein